MKKKAEGEGENRREEKEQKIIEEKGIEQKKIRKI